MDELEEFISSGSSLRDVAFDRLASALERNAAQLAALNSAVLGLEDAASYIGVHPDELIELCKAHPTLRPVTPCEGGVSVFRRADLDAFVAGLKQ
jgi:hypothetical protein